MDGNVMRITKTPLRISFVGGGSDRPGFYLEEPEGGACVAAAIDKYVYVTNSAKYDGSTHAAYSRLEVVQNVSDLKHDLMREGLKRGGAVSGLGREVHSIADIPGGTGLGSSSAFTVGLLNSFQLHTEPAVLAKTACEIEIDRLRSPIGKQDQYVAAFGGVNLYGFNSHGVTVTPVECSYSALGQHCLLLDTGIRRSKDAGNLLAMQQQDRDAVRELAAMAEPFAKALVAGSFQLCGAVMDAAWMIKQAFVANGQVNEWYRQAKWEGAWGGKLCGAGGGGFLLFMAPPQAHARITRALGLREVSIRVGVEGSKVIYSD